MEARVFVEEDAGVLVTPKKQRNHLQSLYLGNSLPKQVHRQYLPDLPRNLQPASIPTRLHQPPPPTVKFTFQYSTQQISFLNMKIHIRADCKLCATLHRKSTDCMTLLNFHSNHSPICKESIVFSQALRYNLLIADDKLLRKELDSLTTSLLIRKYPLDIITHSILKALFQSCATLLCELTKKESGPRTVLPIVTPYYIDSKCFSQSVREHLHIIENDPHLDTVWSTQHITAYKTKSLKDILIHSRQAKPTNLRHKTTPKQDH